MYFACIFSECITITSSKEGLKVCEYNFFWRKVLYLEAVVHRCSVKKVFLEISQISQENTCARVSFLIKLQAWDIFIKKETLAQVCSCEIWEISKNTFSYRTPLVAASVYYLLFTCSITIHLSKLSSCWK